MVWIKWSLGIKAPFFAMMYFYTIIKSLIDVIRYIETFMGK